MLPWILSGLAVHTGLLGGSPNPHLQWSCKVAAPGGPGPVSPALLNIPRGPETLRSRGLLRYCLSLLPANLGCLFSKRPPVTEEGQDK